MFRPVLALLTLCLAAFLLAPTVASVHHKVEELRIDRETPWQIWKWTDEPEPTISYPNCDRVERHLESEIRQWPKRIEKDEEFTLRGHVGSVEEGLLGVEGVEVELFLNRTKDKPGIPLGVVETDKDGSFSLTSKFPYELQAAHYHIIAHAKHKVANCTTYFEHWSDPEMDVVSSSEIRWDPVEFPVAGRETMIVGRLLDAVGGPVQNATLNVSAAGERFTVKTDAGGVFSQNWTPSETGTAEIAGDYKGDRFYKASSNKTQIRVQREAVVLTGNPTSVDLVRSQPASLRGVVYVRDDANLASIRVKLDGASVATCATCPAAPHIDVPVASDGSFTATLVAPADVAPGPHPLVFKADALAEDHRFNATLFVSPVVTMDARAGGLFTRGYDLNMRVVDEAGRPLKGRITLTTPEGSSVIPLDAAGALVHAGEAPTCGRHTLIGAFAGEPYVHPVEKAADARVCLVLSFIPAWLADLPWWVWPLAAALLLAAWRAGWLLRQRYAATIRGGPPLHLAFTQPADDAVGFAGVGETVVATATLEAPLPDGHRLKLGAHHDTRETPLEGELKAHARIAAAKLGRQYVRAEILDAKGRVVSRRTITLNVVRYAEEIERRYLRLRAKSGVADSVTPREFEAWLRQRAPNTDHEVARRLIHLFEEADYSPRIAQRSEFVAYLAAERGVSEVSPDARVV